MKVNTSKITFKNCSYSNRNADVIIFQKNQGLGSITYIWRIIHNCRYDYTNCFEYSKSIDLVIKDNNGNQTLFPNVGNGKYYSFSQETGISEENEAWDPEFIEIENRLEQGSITAAITRNSRIIYEKTEICPNEIVTFSPNNTIYVGRIEAIKEGQKLNEKLLNRFSTKIDLDLIKSADLVLRGGGFGPEAQRHYFVLENIETW